MTSRVDGAAVPGGDPADAGVYLDGQHAGPAGHRGQGFGHGLVRRDGDPVVVARLDLAAVVDDADVHARGGGVDVHQVDLDL
jgi:hypothetical protein